MAWGLKLKYHLLSPPPPPLVLKYCWLTVVKAQRLRTVFVTEESATAKPDGAVAQRLPALIMNDRIHEELRARSRPKVTDIAAHPQRQLVPWLCWSMLML